MKTMNSFIDKHAKILLMLILLMPFTLMYGNNDKLYQKLDKVIEHRNSYIQERDKKLQQLKVATKVIKDKEDLIGLYAQIFDGYYGYNYDSAMVYNKKMYAIASSVGNKQYEYRTNIKRAHLIASRGFYTEALQIMNKINEQFLSSENKFEYYNTLYKIYTFCANYYQNTEFERDNVQKRDYYLKKAIAIGNKHSIKYLSLLAGYYYGIKYDTVTARKYYYKVMAKATINNSLYASAAYTLSTSYKNKDEEKYERNLILSAISDQVCCIKENVALQDLAIYIYNKDKHKNLDIAERYIQISLSDALYY